MQLHALLPAFLLCFGFGMANPGMNCMAAQKACTADTRCKAFGIYNGKFQLHGCATANALVPNKDWSIYIPVNGNKSIWRPLGQQVNVDEAKCASHPTGPITGTCDSVPAEPLPYEALGAIDVGTYETSIFLFNNTRYIQDNIGCGYIDHFGNFKGGEAFKGHSYVRIRERDTGRVVANVSETIGMDFVSSFVDHRPDGDILWLSALDADRCKHTGHVRNTDGTGGGCGTGVMAVSSADLIHFTATTVLPAQRTCNTEVAKLSTTSPRTLPPHRYVMILEPFNFMVNNNEDGNLSYGWSEATGSKAPHVSAGGPSIRHEGGKYYVITGGTTVMLCRSKDLGVSDPWNCVSICKC